MATSVYPNEPGVRVTRQDMGVSSQQTALATDIALIIGTAIDGPNDRPVLYTSMEDLLRDFGPTDRRAELGFGTQSRGYNGNTISRAAQEAWDGGCRAIVVRRIGGTQASTSIAGYNYALDTPVTINTGGAANLLYGGFPLSNIVISNATGTVTTVSGSAVRYSGVTIASADCSEWTFYVPSRQWESRILSHSAQTLTLADSVPSYVVGTDEFLVYPKGSYSIFDANGIELNPANFVLGPGSTSVAATIALRTVQVTDSRYVRNTPTNGEALYVNFYMLPDKVIDVKSRTASNIYNASGSFGTATQDGCWLFSNQSLPTIGTMELYMPKFRGSPLTQGVIPLPSVKFQLTNVGSYTDLMDRLNGGIYYRTIKAQLASNATWNGIPVTINPASGGGTYGMASVPGGLVAMVTPLTSGSMGARLSGGSSGVDMSAMGMYNILKGTTPGTGVLDELVEVPASYRAIAGVYADDTVNGIECAWTLLLAEHCWMASRLGNACQGVIGVRPLDQSNADAAAVQTRVETLTSPDTGIGGVLYGGIGGLDETTGQIVDIGQYLSITAGPDGWTRDPNLGREYSNMSMTYMGLLCSMPLNRSTTYYVLQGSLGINYSYNRYQLERLIEGIGIDDANRGGAFTPFKMNTLTNRLTVHSGETAAKRNSQFTKEGIVKVVQEAEAAVSAAARNYLGKPNTPQTHNAMQHACEMELEKFVEDGSLFGGKGVGYEIQISTNQMDRDIGRVQIAMAITTAVEIRTIGLMVTVKN